MMMKLSYLAVLHLAGCASAQTLGCTGSARNEDGNWFCSAVHHIVYSRIEGEGSYQAVTKMTAEGECSYETKLYSGPLAPLDRDLSLHFRGPLELEEVAVYNPKTHHARKSRKRANVVATIDGQVASWANNWFGHDASPTDAASAGVSDESETATAYASAGGSTPSQTKLETLPDEDGKDWSRIAYYNAREGVAHNMVFLGNYGGQGSGKYSSAWGNSLSFLNASGDGGASTSEILKPGHIRSNREFSIWSEDPCDDSCGYARAEDVAFKGFSGANKIFLFNFKMPLDGDRGFNGDMPAIWALNGEISRSLQYGPCSCWKSGCGEVDFIEVLASGDRKCKSTLHLTKGGGASDYFNRPTDDFARYAVIFEEETASITIRELPKGVEFTQSLVSDTVSSWLNGGKEASTVQFD